MQPNLEFIIDLSKQAGEILKEGYGKVHQVHYKGPIDLVTEIDHESEELLVSRILSTFPDHTVVAEEGGRLRAAWNTAGILTRWMELPTIRAGCPCFVCLSPMPIREK
jgi:fructose-1,6-bisphosphatase/inositol monophosphatase family enzyme